MACGASTALAAHSTNLSAATNEARWITYDQLAAVYIFVAEKVLCPFSFKEA